ncbi:hypothetical protein ACSBR2_016307 [Camellia fascicularis]
MEMVDQICVMASSLPSDKLLLVKCLKEKGQIVAMVGARTMRRQRLKKQMSESQWEVDVPITTIQYFYVCFIVAVPGGLALLMGPPTKTLMKKSPIRSIDSPITRTMWRNIVPQALYQAAILVTFRFIGQAVLDTNQKIANILASSARLNPEQWAFCFLIGAVS